jgi:hypothetical protein
MNTEVVQSLHALGLNARRLLNDAETVLTHGSHLTAASLAGHHEIRLHGGSRYGRAVTPPAGPDCGRRCPATLPPNAPLLASAVALRENPIEAE